MKSRSYLINLILLIGFSFISYIIYQLNHHIEENRVIIEKMITKEALSNFNNIVSARQWNANHGEVFVKESDEIKSNPYLNNGTIKTEDGETLVKINPAWMTRQISEISNKINKNYYKLTSLKPLNPQNKPDSFEKEALQYLENNPKETYYTKISKDRSQFHFLGALVVNESCLQCHQQQGYTIGDVRGGIRISIPTKEYFYYIEQNKEKHYILMAVIAIVTIFLAFLSLWFVKLINERQKTIEDHYQHIEELQKENEVVLARFNYALEGTQDGLWDWDLKTNNVYFSKNWKLMLGYEEHEIENRLEEWDIRVHPDDKDEAIKDLEENQKGVTSLYKNIHRLRHKNGSWVWILDRGKTYYDNSGKAIRMVGFHTNITELKNLEEKLEFTQNELSKVNTVLESAPISIIITDIHANIIYVNPHFCEITGYTKEEIIGENPRVLKLDQEDSEAMYEDLWQTITNKKTWGGIFRNRKKDGGEYWETATILPILDKNGDIVNYLGIMREITQEVYLEKALHEKEELMLMQSKNAAMGEMISMIAHQWRQPITAISMSANNIIADIELEMFEKDETKKIAQNIAEQTQFLSKTIDDFRNFFRKDKTKEKTTFRNIFNEISSIILASLKNNNITLELNFNQDKEVTTYPRELIQVLLNIIKNAKEAFIDKAIENKHIQITIQDEIQEDMKIIITDNAGGIPTENLEKIFEPYFTTKEEYNGTGLGLYMSKMIVEKHLKGELIAYNNEKGATFEIHLKKVIK